jgi:hypothetical protein
MGSDVSAIPPAENAYETQVCLVSDYMRKASMRMRNGSFCASACLTKVMSLIDVSI